jgi:hypothetical protein
MMTLTARLFLSATFATLSISITALSDGAIAASPNRSQEGTIKACSRRGHGCITSAVRQGRQGPEVRLPGGTWVGCAGDCRESLLEKTLDFWDMQLEVAPDSSGN